MMCQSIFIFFGMVSCALLLMHARSPWSAATLGDPVVLRNGPSAKNSSEQKLLESNNVLDLRNLQSFSTGLPSELPALSLEHAPWATRWNNTLAICTTMRDENNTDVIEWLSYYR